MTMNDNDISSAIADYCNDRMTTKERQLFEKRLREDKEMEREYADFRGFQNLYRQIDPSEPAPSEEVFSRISQAVRLRPKRIERPKVQSQGVTKLALNLWQLLRTSVAMPWAFAAIQAAVIVLLLVPGPQQAMYSTLSGTEMAAKVDKRGINVVFQESATEGEIRQLLQGIGGSVGSGPSREGRYVVEVEAKSDLVMIVGKLQQSPIIAFAEVVQ